MREFKYVVTDPEGIHARPAGELVKAVKAFSSDIKIAKGGKAMNCKAIFGIMGLAVKKGDEVTLTFEGADEDAAYEAVSKFMLHEFTYCFTCCFFIITFKCECYFMTFLCSKTHKTEDLLAVSFLSFFFDHY